MEKKFVINLPHRTDRWSNFSEKNSSYMDDICRVDGTPTDKIPENAKVSIKRPYYHIMSSKNIIGNLLSHINILKNNLDNDYDIIVLEDDCYITSEGLQYYESHKRFIPTDCDVFMLSSIDTILPSPINKYVYRVIESFGLYSVMYMNSSKKKIIELVEDYILKNGYNLLDNILLELDLNIFTFLKNYSELYESESDVILEKFEDYGIRYTNFFDINQPKNNIINYYYIGKENHIEKLDLKWLSPTHEVVDYDIIIDNINVINLPDRTDRWSNFIEKNKEYKHLFNRVNGVVFYGIPNMDKRYSEIYGNRIAIAGILEAHIKVLEDSLDNEDDVIVFEDDCYITPEGMEYFNTHKKFIPKDFDVFLLSSFESSLPDKVNDFVLRSINSLGLHSVLYNGKKKKQIVESVKKWVSEKGYYPLDMLYYDLGLNIYKFFSNLTDLYDSYSNNFKRIAKHSDSYIKYEDVPNLKVTSKISTKLILNGSISEINFFESQYRDPHYVLIERNYQKLFRYKFSNDEIDPEWNATISLDYGLICNSSVRLKRNYKFLPFKFKEINGNFDLRKEGLISYKGVPRIVRGDFYTNERILNYPPTIIEGEIYSNQPNFSKINEYVRNNKEKFYRVSDEEFDILIKSLKEYKIYYMLCHINRAISISSIIENYFDTVKNPTVVEIGTATSIDNIFFEQYSKYNFDFFSIEPVKENFEILVDKYNNTEIKFINYAISDKNSDDVIMYGVNISEKDHTWYDKLYSLDKFYSLDKNILLSNKKYIPHIETLLKEISVKTITFENLYKTHINKKINLLEIDTMGHDYRIYKQLNIDELDLDILILEHVYLSMEELSDIISSLLPNYDLFYDNDNLLAKKKI